MVTTKKKPNIAFVCDWNTARSIIAEEIINNEFSDLFTACSAGVEASDYVDPFVIGLIKEKYDRNLINKEPRSFTYLNNLNNIDLIVTLSPHAFDAIKMVKKLKGFSTPVEFWDTPVPPDKNQSRDNIVTEYRNLFHEIKQHIENRFCSKI